MNLGAVCCGFDARAQHGLAQSREGAKWVNENSGSPPPRSSFAPLHGVCAAGLCSFAKAAYCFSGCGVVCGRFLFPS